MSHFVDTCVSVTGALEAKPVEGSQMGDIRFQSADRSALRRAMENAFSLEDLDLLCQDVQEELKNSGIALQVNMELVGGQDQGKAGKILRLIEFLDCRGYFPYLSEAAHRARPEIIPKTSPDDVTVLSKCFRVLGDRIIDNPEVRATVCLSEDKLKIASVQIDEMEFFKTIHDALHDIEHDCLQPMTAADTVDGLEEYKDAFDEAAKTINDAIEGREMTPLLQNLRDRLKWVATDFQAVIENPGDAAFVKAVRGLNGIITKVPPRLDANISGAAKKLNLDNLVDLLTQVRDSLSGKAGSGLFVQSIEALPKIRDELTILVSKHCPLQSLDYNVRTMCVAEAIPADLASEWQFIMLERSRLAPMGELDKDLAKIESAINDAIIKNNKSDVMDHLKAYLARVSKEFRKVDKELKKLCLNLSRVNQPLQTVLELCNRG
jgi:hypothetical protein